MRNNRREYVGKKKTKKITYFLAPKSIGSAQQPHLKKRGKKKQTMNAPKKKRECERKKLLEK